MFQKILKYKHEYPWKSSLFSLMNALVYVNIL